MSVQNPVVVKPTNVESLQPGQVVLSVVTVAEFADQPDPGIDQRHPSGVTVLDESLTERYEVLRVEPFSMPSTKATRVVFIDDHGNRYDRAYLNGSQVCQATDVHPARVRVQVRRLDPQLQFHPATEQEVAECQVFRPSTFGTHLCRSIAPLADDEGWWSVHPSALSDWTDHAFELGKGSILLVTPLPGDVAQFDHVL